MNHETIAAMATPIGTGGIGIIRLSGKEAVSIADAIFTRQKIARHQKTGTLENTPSHCMKYGHIIDPGTQHIVDEVMVVVMRAPNSYTREDVVEIQSHSGQVIMSTVLKLALEQGARLAHPGEFTKRAFLNGRIDLSQAEAVADVISARSESALQLATTHLTGMMRQVIDGLIETIDAIQVELEARIEFPDDTEDDFDLSSVGAQLSNDVKHPIEELLDRYRQGHLLRDGVRLGIVGRPNVGKSSLLNRILMKDRAIVTPIAGTTRDLIEDQTCIEGVPVLITDTAGLRPSTDPIEIVGIEKAQESIATSDIILFVVDGSQPLSREDDAVHEMVKDRKTILCINKIDLASEEGPRVASNAYPFAASVKISAKTGAGINDLKLAIKDRCLHDVQIDPERTIVPNQRQKIALQEAGEFVNQAVAGIQEGITDELIVSDLNQAKDALRLISGAQAEDDLLDRIFNRFCIGK